jgi:hypothetical protein
MVVRFVTIGAVKAILCLGAFPSVLVHICCPVCVISVRDVRVMLLIICEFRKNRRTEDRALLMGVNEITFVRVPCSCMTF